MRFRAIALTTLLFLLTGCVAADRSVVPNRTYPRSYSFYDLLISWETTSNRENITISGTLKNQSYYYILGPVLTATLLDADGNIIGEGTFIFFPRQLALDEIAPFTIRIPVKEGAVVDRIRFTYRYRLAEKEMQDPPRFHSFEAKP